METPVSNIDILRTHKNKNSLVSTTIKRRDLMNRRNLLKLSSVAGLAFILPRIGLADVSIPNSEISQPEELNYTTDIQNNHGHALVLGFKAATRIFRRLKQDESAFFDIEGDAGHTHSIELTRIEIESIIWGAVVSKKTTIGAGHNHPFTVRLEV